jgi:hypothetical protein
MKNRACRHLIPLTMVAAVVIFASAATVSVAAAGVNVCKVTGTTTALAIKVLGAGSRALDDRSGEPATCKLSAQDTTHHASIEVVLFSKSWIRDAVPQDENQGQTDSTVLKGLGTAAVFVFTPNHNFEHAWFQVGAHTVELTNDGPPNQPKSFYPTEAEYVALAHAVYAHLS